MEKCNRLYEDASVYLKNTNISVSKLLKLYIVNFSFRVIFLLRIYQIIISFRYRFLLKPVIFFIKVLSKYAQRKSGIQIGLNIEIGGGLKFEHFGGIVIGAKSIGKHCNIFQNVTIGYAGRPGKGGSPIIGDNVVIGAGACIVGPITIGNNVFIGANAYVCENIPDNAVVGASKSTIISYNGTKGYFGN